MTNRDYLKSISHDYFDSYGFELPWQIPDYARATVGDWSLRYRPRCLAGSYLAHEIVEAPHAILMRSNEVWMSTGLLEAESHAWHLHCATGNVLVAGLGMGMYLHAASMKPSVSKIVVLENDPEVIALMRNSTSFDGWQHRDKIEILEADALAAETAGKVSSLFGGARPDYLYADIWPTFPHPDAPSQTKAMFDIFGARRAGWWGQEVEFGLWLSDAGKTANFENLGEFFEAHGINALTSAGYVAFCQEVIAVQLDLDLEAGRTPSLSFG